MSGFLAQYDSLGTARKAIETLREAGHEDLEVFSPVMSAELEEALGIHSSPVRRWALIGAIWPAYFIIIFEMTILFTGLFGFAGVLHHTRRPGRISPQYRESFSVDRYGVFVPSGAATESDRQALESMLRESGAVAVEVAE
jgi:hypothetical protein